MGTVRRMRAIFKLSVLSLFLGALPIQMAHAVDDPIVGTTPRVTGGVGTTDSTSVTKRQNPKIMQPMTSAVPASSVGIYGFEDANNFVAILANKCTPNTTLPVCFTRVSVSVLGSSTPDGGAACPDGYETLMNYGTGIMYDATGQTVYHYAYDEHLWTSLDQWNWYYTQGYQLSVCPAWERWQIEVHKDVGKNLPNPFFGWGAPNQLCTSDHGAPCDAYVPDNIIDNNYGSYTVGWLESASCNMYCYTQPRVPMDCRNSVVGDYSSWYCTLNMLCRSLFRPAGFYTAPPNGYYPVGAVGTDISPTIKICGKKQLIWREKP